ncbi:MAG: aspartate:alanine exchanger family transporter [Candidatus Korobacteraceae bacterium]
MHGPIVSTLTQNPILTLFVVIGLGYVLGETRLFGFRFGVATVLFVGLAVGSLSPSISVPETIPTLGLIIFIYTIGIQTGPEFFKSLRQQGYRQSLFALVIVALGAGVTLLVSRPMHLARPRLAGLYTGAMTNTPALAAVRELLVERGRAAGFSPDQLRALSDEPVIAYSIAYPVGVIGVLVSFAVWRRRWKPTMEPLAEGPEIRVRNFQVINPAVIDRTLEEVLQSHRDPGFVISRIQHDQSSDIARDDTLLQRGDIVVAVGDDDALESAERIFGHPLDAHIEQDRSQLDFRRVFVSRQEIVGKRIRELNLENAMGATVTRLRRGDLDLVPTRDTRLELGDRVRVLTRRENFPAISRFFGDSIRGTAETDFGSVALGMVLGVLLGLVPIPLPGGTIRLGFAGGPLLIALVLGKLERTGRITWTIPLHTNLTLRQIGLLFFLAGVGIRAGYSFAQTLRQNGPAMLLAGAVVTLVITEVSLVVGYKCLKIPFASLMGLVSGIQTQPACLAYATREANSDAPNLSYAAVYPLTTIAKIILAQLLS